MTLFILSVNILLFLAMEISGLLGLGNMKYVIFGAQYGPLLDMGDWFRIVTAIFVHGGILHLFFNMYALYYLGTIVEHLYGPWRYIVIYAVSGVVGNLISLMFYYDAIVIGASGALFGLAGIAVVAGFKSDTSYYMRGISVSLIPMVIFNIVYGFIPGSHINNAAHLGGFATGVLLGYLIPVNFYSAYLSPVDLLRQLFSKQVWTNPWFRKQREESLWAIAALTIIFIFILSFVLLVASDVHLIKR